MRDFIKSLLLFTSKTLVLLILILIFASGFTLLLIEPSINRISSNKEFYSTGTAKKEVTPDIAYINISANFTGTSALELKKKADKSLNDTVSALKALEIPEEKIKTNYTITPKYDKDYQNIVGYTTTPTLVVNTKDFTLVDKVVEAAQNNGLNLVNNVYFTLEDPDKATQVLRDEAIEDAKTNAKKLAEQTGIRLGSIINISENNYRPYSSSSMMELKVASPTLDSTSSGSSSSFTPGQTEINLTVTLTYQLY